MSIGINLFIKMGECVVISLKRKLIDKIAYGCFLFSATFAIVITLSLIWFVFARGLRPFLPENRYGTYSIIHFLTGDTWRPRFHVYGIGYMIISTLVATFWAVVCAIPIALGAAIFIVEFAPKWLAKILHFSVECLAGIPSVFYGIFGFFKLLPLIQRISPYPYGESLIAVIVMLALMSLPTMCLIMINALEAVDPVYKEGSFALGTSKRQTVVSVMIPAAKSGLLAGMMMGAARAIGETMAVTLVAGNRESGYLQNPFQTVRLLTTNIVLEQSYAAELHAQLLWSTAVVLLIFIMLINITLRFIHRGGGK